MPASVSTYREDFCSVCGHREISLTWLAIDLNEHPERQSMLQRADAYTTVCPRCQHRRHRDVPLLVLNLSEAAPIILACPDEMFALDDPARGSSALLEQVQSSLDAENRRVPGPVLLAPFDVLVIALGRELGRDLARPDGAVHEVAAAHGEDAGRRYSIFLGDVNDCLPIRRLDEAIHALLAIRGADDLHEAVRDHPELLNEGVRDWLRSIIDRANAANDHLGARIARAQLNLLERCAKGEVTEGWDEYVAENAYAEHVEPQVQALWERFREAQQLDLARATVIGEELVAMSAHFHLVQSEAPAAFETANAYWERTDGDRIAHVERACQLLERVLELCHRHRDQIDQRLRADATLNLAAAVGARGLGDPAANQERALALQRETLTLISRDRDARRWAMVQTNLGLSLIERARSLERRLHPDDDAEQRGYAMIAEAVEHFEAALTWRSFEQDPRDWGFTQINLALAYSRGLGGDRHEELRRAIEHLSDAIKGFDATGDRVSLAQAMANRANALVDLATVGGRNGPGPEQLLAGAEEDARKAIETIGEHSRGLSAGRCWWQLARVLAARYGYVPMTIAAFNRSLKDLTAEAVPWDRREAARQLADLATTAGDWRQAAQSWRQAAEAGLAAVQARATLSGRLAEVGANGNVVRWAGYALVKIGALLEAVEILERGRALQLAAWLRRDVVDLRPVREASRDLYARFVDLSRRVEIGERETSAVADATFTGIAEELRSVVQQIRTLPGLDSFLAQPALTELIPNMARDEAIAYPLTSPWGSAWLVVSRTEEGDVHVDAVELPATTSTAIFQSLVRIDSATDNAEGYLIEQSRHSRGDHLDEELRKVSSILGPELMMPLAKALKQAGRQSVCIIALGPLALVPLHALSWRTADSATCLLDEFEIAYAPSAYIRGISKRRAACGSGFDRLLSVGNPLPQRKPLEQSEIEAELVAATVPADDTMTLIREDATKAAVLAALPLASHAHFACHGSAASDPLGLDAALLFADDEPASAGEILDLDLAGARLIVASACETGVVAGHDTLDEALALSTIFLAAGAGGVIASLWKVNDFATRLLMTRFYEELVASPDRPARALREAQLWLRHLTIEQAADFMRSHSHLFPRRDATGAPIREDPGAGFFRAPTTWAGFTLNGA